MVSYAWRDKKASLSSTATNDLLIPEDETQLRRTAKGCEMLDFPSHMAVTKKPKWPPGFRQAREGHKGYEYEYIEGLAVAV